MTDRSPAGAIVVCGGLSTRMGTAKALLPFGAEVMLQRIVRIVREAVAGPTVVVTARGRVLPPLPPDVVVAFDAHAERGPLEGLHAGLVALEGRCAIAFATGCDAPLLRSEFVRVVVDQLTGYDAAVPRTADGRLYPLAAAYRIDAVLPQVAELLAGDQLRATGIIERVRTRFIDEDDLRAIDPQLNSLRNINTPDDYQPALRDAGLAAPKPREGGDLA